MSCDKVCVCRITCCTGPCSWERGQLVLLDYRIEGNYWNVFSFGIRNILLEVLELSLNLVTATGMDYFKKYTFSKCLLRTFSLPTPFYLFSKKRSYRLWHCQIAVACKITSVSWTLVIVQICAFSWGKHRINDINASLGYRLNILLLSGGSLIAGPAGQPGYWTVTIWA